MTTLALFGATGFVGGDVFYSLLTDTSGSAVGIETIIAPVSSEQKEQKVQAWLQRIQGSGKVQVEVPVYPRDQAKQWYEAAEEMSRRADVVLQLATSDDLELTRAINRGLKASGGSSKSGKRVLIHASGVQLIESEPNGNYVDVPKYDDSSPQSIASIPDDAAHRSIDVEIDQEFRKGSFCGAVICPALVWGKARGPDNVLSVMVPDMIRKSLHNGKGTYVGQGTNQWVHVNVHETSDLILALVKKYTGEAHTSRDAFANFYFVSNNDGRIAFKDVAAHIAKALHAAGKLASADTMSVPAPHIAKGQKGVRIEDAARSEADAEEEARTPLWPTRTNCDCIAKRGEQDVGWRATMPYDSDAIARDVQATLEAM